MVNYSAITIRIEINHEREPLSVHCSLKRIWVQDWIILTSMTPIHTDQSSVEKIVTRTINTFIIIVAEIIIRRIGCYTDGV